MAPRQPPLSDVSFLAHTRTFLIRAPSWTYAFRVDDARQLEHLYWGPPLTHPQDDLSYLLLNHSPVSYDQQHTISAQKPSQQLPAFPPAEPLDPARLGANTRMFEFVCHNGSDFRTPSFIPFFPDSGSSLAQFKYHSHKILPGKPPMLSGLPALYTEHHQEATTLVVILTDPPSALQLHLHYTLFRSLGILTRHTRLYNNTPSSQSFTVTIHRLMSATVDFETEHNFHITHFEGGWGRERQPVTEPVTMGIKSIHSIRGASSHQLNPHVILQPRQPASETAGECFAFTFIYSGSFLITCEKNEYGRVRLHVGLHPQNFSWHLANSPDQNVFCTPEVVLSYSSSGLGPLSRTLHRAFRERLVPKQWRYHIPPVLINTWEAVYFDVTHENALQLAKKAARSGVQLLVVDDGWFARRSNPQAGLGDWKACSTKFPNGLAALANDLRQIDMQLGLWVEPEMVSVQSDLYKAHPDWCISVPHRERTTGRFQLVLDLTRSEVRDYIVNILSQLLRSANISYFKWDMNRFLTEVYSTQWPPERQGEMWHRYILGLYQVLRCISAAFPDVLIESCAGGGGRFDAGMLAFTPQIWASDNSDAVWRTKIQHGTSMAYPPSAIGAHVSFVPNHQTMRWAPLKTRAAVAMCGTFGLELDARIWSDEQIEEMAQIIRVRNRVAPLVARGDLYRLCSPFEGQLGAWMFVSQDCRIAFVVAVCVAKEVGALLPRLRLQGLCEDFVYEVTELLGGTAVVRNLDSGELVRCTKESEPRKMSGNVLHGAGLVLQMQFETDCAVFFLSAVNGYDAQDWCQ